MLTASPICTTPLKDYTAMHYAQYQRVYNPLVTHMV